ncbi:hypothetical protein [Streptomyces sp. NPDC048637]|uniref:hypothetical protein n=1 Tax=Streptomyces sp. NPDC048637 TaxID=3155636 RepID=UPI003447C0F5
MTAYDAQTALDAIRHHQEQTRNEYVRHVSSGAYGLIAALAVFAVGSSVDLPRPWNLVAMLAGDVLIVGGLVMQYRQARVRRKHSPAEVLLTVWLAAVVIAIFIAALIAGRLIDLSIPSVPAAAVAALATLVANYATRPIVKKITKRNNQG